MGPLGFFGADQLTSTLTPPSLNTLSITGPVGTKDISCILLCITHLLVTQLYQIIDKKIMIRIILLEILEYVYEMDSHNALVRFRGSMLKKMLKKKSKWRKELQKYLQMVQFCKAGSPGKQRTSLTSRPKS